MINGMQQKSQRIDAGYRKQPGKAAVKNKKVAEVKEERKANLLIIKEQESSSLSKTQKNSRSEKSQTKKSKELELTPQKLILSLKDSKDAESCPEEDAGELEGARSVQGEKGDERCNQLYQKEFLEDLLLNNEVAYYEADQEPEEWFQSLMEQGHKDDDNISLLDDDFGDDDSLEDPFAFGTEKIMKDIMQDELYQRSLSKLSQGHIEATKRNSLEPFQALPQNLGVDSIRLEAEMTQNEEEDFQEGQAS